MASYQLDFQNLVRTRNDIFNLITRFRSSNERSGYIQAESYYSGNNWTIMNLPDRQYWSDRILKDEKGETRRNKDGEPIRANTLVRNPFVANNRVAYGIFHDIVSQKVNTLFGEDPYINTTFAIDDKYREQLAYAFKNAATEASICGMAFVYEDMEGGLTVFDTANCIPFFDDYTGALRALIRFVERQGTYNKRRSILAEVYTEDGLEVLEKIGAQINIINKLTPYKFNRRSSIILNEIKSIGLSNLPIVVLYNNETATSDLTPSIRAKIDVIDLVQSGFINNIEDFSDIYWVIKKAPGGGVSEDDYNDFFANINKTKRLFADDATPEQFSIPHEARSKAIEMLELQIIKESGVIDNEKLSSTALTTTAIKTATMKLEQRVSDFEWFVNEAITTAVKLWQEYNNKFFEFKIDFTKLLVNNVTESIDNLVKIRSDISQKTALEILQKLKIIDDAEEELKELQKEREASISLFEEPLLHVEQNEEV